MSTWLRALTDLRQRREPAVLVTVSAVRGHAPREAGAKMVVTGDATWASIGGGNLEEQAVCRARELIGSRVVTPESFVARLSDKVPYAHGVQCCGGEVTVLLEPQPVVASLAIFGLGHVGMELARILSRHDLDLHLVDSRAQYLSDEALSPLANAVAAVHTHHVPVIPELVLSTLPRGTRVLVLTHDHAEDLAIVDAALRCDHLGRIGLIGSTTKWARFRGKLVDAGLAPDDVDRVQTPIGFPGLSVSKDPAAIAVSVVAEWLANIEDPARDESSTVSAERQEYR